MERMLGLLGLTGEEVSRVAANAVEAEREIVWNAADSWQDDGYYLDYMRGLGVGLDQDFTLFEDVGFAGIRHAFNNLPLDMLRDYLAWTLVRKNAKYLDGGMMDEYLDLTGALNVRTTSVEKVARDHVQAYHWEEMSGAVIERLTRPGMMETYEGMAREMVAVARERIAGATWIQDASTREEALRKLDRMEIYLMGKRVNTRGGASTWTSAMECEAVSRKAKRESVMAREGTYVTKLEINEFWNRLEFNAMYLPGLNLFDVWAGVVTPAIFPGWDDEAFVYGYLGCVMGHEMMHGFDNDGRLYDSEGRTRDWWTAGDAARFEERAVRVRDYFSTLTYGDGYRVDGERVLGECIADLGGVSIAHEAMKRVTGGDEFRDANGFTAAQRFFFGFVWFFAEANPETNMNLYLTDEHVYSPLRVVSIYANTDAWYEAFPEVKPGDKWYIAPADRVGVW
ncbi:M13-type metalloendopeptidase [Butyricimonas paravirosa]|uniref:M13-type metalloendopeptidase n=1 Tax=Butyricimonas paravirosa TaxID=1472417 RepID=UPI00210AA6F2|nr:M13-type metalloendopeptidase [Butyricimonas paravirosa]MCQ4873189.1 hypothetical protein [Butyricimonas paravirosa]